MNLPSPDGHDHYGPGAWWRLSDGSLLFATPGEVSHDRLYHLSPDQVEQDALAALAAVAWARTRAPQAHGSERIA